MNAFLFLYNVNGKETEALQTGFYVNEETSRKAKKIKLSKGEYDFLLQSMKEKIIVAERCILYTLGFDMTTQQPFMKLTNIVDNLCNSLDRSFNKIQTYNDAISILNDSLCTPLGGKFDPEYLVPLAVYIIVLYRSIPLPRRYQNLMLQAQRHSSQRSADNEHAKNYWMDFLGVEDEEMFLSSCREMISYYSMDSFF